MFERIFRSSMVFGARVLFAVSIVVLIIGIFQAFVDMGAYTTSMPQGSFWVPLLIIFRASLAPAAYLFFGALLIERVDRIIERLRP